MIRSRRTAGTTLVEILVVIVVFLIGILAIVQIFPGGFRLLGLTRSQSVATQLARSEIERIKTKSDQLPDRIVPVRFVRNGGQLVAIAADRRTSDLGPTADGLSQIGEFTNGADNLGAWRYNVGGNNVTRIVGEGQQIPAPRPAVGVISGNTYYGGLMNLQFGPAVFNTEVAGASADNDVLFNVYANDLYMKIGNPLAPTPAERKGYEAYMASSDTNAAKLFIPRGGSDVRYRVAMTAYIVNGGNTRTIEVLDYVGTVFAAGPGLFQQIDLNTLFVPGNFGMVAGDVFAGVQFDSVAVAPVFERIPKGTAFTQNPYEYKLMDDVNPGVTNANMGVLLFSPAGYNYFIPDSEGRRIPLTARVNYNVYDWGVLKNDFRIPSGVGENLRLTVSSLKIKGGTNTDGRIYQGLGFNVPNGAGGNQELDVVVQDTETGGIYAYDPTSNITLGNPNLTAYTVDRSIGLVRFQDRDTTTPALELTMYEPGTWNPIQIDDARGRSVRVFYQTNQEYQVQVFKAASRYVGISGLPGSDTECSLGAIGDVNQETKLYFSESQQGRHASIGQAYVLYDPDTPAGPLPAEVRLMSFSSVVVAPRSGGAEPVDRPYLNMDDVFGLRPAVGIEPVSQRRYAVSWSTVDETGKNPGWIVRQVRGASVAVRVLWNPQKFSLGADPVANLNAFDKWAANWRKSTTETFLQKGGLQ